MKRMLMGLSLVVSSGVAAWAQDVPGIEICTVDKTWERRTSCLQSNVDFLVKTINKMKSDQDVKLDAARRQIEAQSSAMMTLQKMVAEMAAKKPDAVSAPAKDPTSVAKDTAPAPAPAKKSDAR